MPSVGNAPAAAVRAPAKAGPNKAAAFRQPSITANARTSLRSSDTPGTIAIAVGRNRAEHAPLSPAARKRCHNCKWPASPRLSGNMRASNLTEASTAMNRPRCNRSDKGEPSNRMATSGMLKLSAIAPMAILDAVIS
ncbi:hypothetical protein AMS66_16420 [Paenibacillus xylanivorans]|uniref:Uncharacterized protein n=1 Tax=Paenibacillus xylanivorans TaxID=1705561 RepID=A0A0M9BP92_9BACL|nr:hypothetical protein AMS66_16420 [Paenibacillus xylanivorans]